MINNAGGTITGGNRGIRADQGNVTVTNNAGATITGSNYAIFVANAGGSSVFNAGSLSGGTAAIQFAGTGNTLTLAPGSAITGNVLGTGSDTFQLGGTGTATFIVSQLGAAAQYRGFGTFNKIGSSTWTLTGTTTYTGPVNVNAGTLAVNGDIRTSSLTTVNAGGTLGGTGTVGNTSVAGGVFAPGSGTAGTTQTVSGTLGFSAGGIYRVFVDPAQSSSANVSGNATLTGGTVNAQFAPGGYVARSYTILTAGTRTGTFDALTTNMPGFAASLGYGVNNVTLNLAISSSSTSNLPPNQQGPANAIANYFNSGGTLPPGFVTLIGLTGQAQQDGYAQVSGEGGNGATQTAAYFATNLFLGAMLDPSIDGRGSDEDNGGGASGYAAEESDALAYAGQRKATKATRDAYAAVTPRDRRKSSRDDSFGARWSVWATGYGGSMSVGGNAAVGTHTTTSSIAGTAVGADYRVGRDTLIGVAMGGAGVNFNTAQGLGGGRADLFQLGVYGRHNIGAAYIAGALAYGWQDVTIDRTVTVAGIDRLRSNFDSNTFAARAEAGYRVAVARMGVTPYAALQVTTFRLPSYAESAVSGSNQFALAIAGDTATNLRSELGLRADKSMAMRDGFLTLRSRLAWAHDSNTDRVITPTFQALPGSGAFTVSGAVPSADGALVSAGAEMKWRNGWAVAGTFEGEFSRTTESYAGKGAVRYTW